MSLALDDLPRDHERMLQKLQQMTEVIAQQNAALVSLQAERDTAWSERDAAQAEVEKLRLLIRQLQRGRFGRRSEKLDPDQLQLGLEDLEQTVAAAEAAQEEVAARSGAPRPPRARRRNLGALPAPDRGSRSWSTSRTRIVPAAAGPCTSSARAGKRCSTSCRRSC